MPKKPRLEITWPMWSDLEYLVQIYNQAIRSGIATGHTEEFTRLKRRPWYRSHTRHKYPLYVMKLNYRVIGYGTLSPYREGRQAMESIAEVSFFMDENFQRKGLGSMLLQHMIDDCPRVKINTLIAILLDVNKPSARLLRKFGFEKWAHLKGIIEFEDKTCGQLIYGKKLQG
jgi:L-amino acid N-acyltransferase YncA